MVLDSVKSIVKDALATSEGDLSPAWFYQKKKEILRKMPRLCLDQGDEAGRWLKENESFLRRAVEGIDTKRMFLSRFVFNALSEWSKLSHQSLGRDDWRHFLEFPRSRR